MTLQSTPHKSDLFLQFMMTRAGWTNVIQCFTMRNYHYFKQWYIKYIGRKNLALTLN